MYADKWGPLTQVVLRGELGLSIVWKSLREVPSIPEALYLSNQDIKSYDLKVILQLLLFQFILVFILLKYLKRWVYWKIVFIEFQQKFLKSSETRKISITGAVVGETCVHVSLLKIVLCKYIKLQLQRHSQ